MNTRFLPYIALLLLIVIGADSWMHRRRLNDTLRNIQNQIEQLDHKG